MNLRALAAHTVTAVLKDGRSLAELMPIAAQKCTDPRDKGLLQEMVYGVLRHYRRLAAVRDKLLRQRLGESTGLLANLMLVGLYQLLYTRVPGHAAVAATVDGVDDIDEPRARGLVNAILRRTQREGDELLAEVDKHWELKYSHPDWLIQALKNTDKTSLLASLEANNHPAPMTLRVNTQKGSRAHYLEKLSALGMNATPHAEAKDALTLEEPLDVLQLPGFRDGEVSVQDAAAQLAADYLQLTPNLEVLDACCAPGGKTAHMLEREPSLNVVAVDNDAIRLLRVKENLARLGLNATVKQADASRPDSIGTPASFDRILLDAPCSGTGVIRRHPDIKWLRRQTDIPTLANTQLQLLSALWTLLKPEGYLLYATCSSLGQENEQVIERFLQSEKSAALAPLGESVATGSQRRIVCGEQGMDGFFYALLQKQSA